MMALDDHANGKDETMTQALLPRTLGVDGPPVSAIGLGLAALGRPGYLNLGHGADLGDDLAVETLEAHAHRVLDVAWEVGIRSVDVARSYGLAEAFLASWLAARGHEPGALTISSKWGYTYTADWRVDADPPEVKDLSAPTFRRQRDETLALLDGHLALEQIHSATVESGVLDDRAVLEELAALRATGVRIGVTTTGPEQRATIERALEVGGFDAVQTTWNLHERSAEPALMAAHQAGLGVIVKEALANGRLTARGANPRLIDVARRLGATPDAVALASVLARPWADVVLSGASTEAQLRSNVAAAEIAWDATLEPELAALTESPEAYWTRRSAMRWT